MVQGMQGMEETRFTGFEHFSAVAPELVASRESVYNAHQNRLYAFAFWMTGNELQAEELMERTFVRAFLEAAIPTQEMLDRALVAEVQSFTPLGMLTLNQQGTSEVLNVRGNVKRCELERAVLQLPATERLIYLMHDGDGYSHAQVASTLAISERDSRRGLHQARLELRSLLAQAR